jgi:hypothetical protein
LDEYMLELTRLSRKPLQRSGGLVSQVPEWISIGERTDDRLVYVRGLLEEARREERCQPDWEAGRSDSTLTFNCEWIAIKLAASVT